MKVQIIIVADMKGLPKSQLAESAGDELSEFIDQAIEGGDYVVTDDDDKTYEVEFSVQHVRVEPL